MNWLGEQIGNHPWVNYAVIAAAGLAACGVVIAIVWICVRVAKWIGG